MSAEYSVEEVRARFEAWAAPTYGIARHSGLPDQYAAIGVQCAWAAWQAAYAERVRADEGAVPFGWVNFIGELSATKKNSDDTPVFTHPAPDDGAGVPFCPECGTCRDNQQSHPALSDEDVRDAERWRYLRREVISASWLINGGSLVKALEDSCDPSAFDRAIDAAIQGERHER